MKIIYVRHGETDWNVQHRFQGQTDIPLNATGRQQAEETAKLLQHDSIDVVYTSPLSRAKETAAIINRFHHAPTFEDARLIERHFGVLEGQVSSGYDISHLWDYSDPSPYEDEELLPHLFQRVYEFLDSLRGKEGTALLVAHGGVGVCMRCYAQGLDPKECHSALIMKNGEALRFEV